MFRYDKNIVCFVDNDAGKIGNMSPGGAQVRSPGDLRDIDYDRIIISTCNYSAIVLQLEDMGIHNYVYFDDVYSWQLDCKCREIMDRYILEYDEGQYTGRFVKNAWMNHLTNHYSGKEYATFIPLKGSILDVGSGCGTSLFYWLLQDYDAHGVDCCQWKLDFCRQKIEDFHFPNEWSSHFHFGYGESLPFKDGWFDLVTSWYVLEHVQDVEACLREMVRVMKPGGTIFINAPDYRNSYEEHYGIDIGKPMVENKGVLRETIVAQHKSLEIFEDLNFITKPEIIGMIKKFAPDDKLEIIDMEIDAPGVVREEGRLKYRRRIQLVVKKHSGA